MWNTAGRKRIVVLQKVQQPALSEICSGPPKPAPHLLGGVRHLGAAGSHPADPPQCLRYLLMLDLLWSSWDLWDCCLEPTGKAGISFPFWPMNISVCVWLAGAIATTTQHLSVDWDSVLPSRVHSFPDLWAEAGQHMQPPYSNLPPHTALSSLLIDKLKSFISIIHLVKLRSLQKCCLQVTCPYGIFCSRSHLGTLKHISILWPISLLFFFLQCLCIVLNCEQ